MTSLASDFKKFQARKLAREFTLFQRQALQGQNGRDGQDGASVSVEQVVSYLLATPSFLDMIRGRDGKDGRDGVDGTSGRDGTQGPKGSDGLSIDEQELLDKVLSSDEFVNKVRKLMPVGGLGISPSVVNIIRDRVTALENTPTAGVKYLQITSVGTTTYTSTDLIFGTNIIGVNAAGAVTIQLPDTLTAGTIVTVKDESLSAGTNNITIETYLEN